MRTSTVVYYSLRIIKIKMDIFAYYNVFNRLLVPYMFLLEA